MLNYFGYLFLMIFIMFLFRMIQEGPFIFERGTKHFVNIKDLAFDVKELKIKRGDTVVWTNFDQIRHTVANDEDIVNSGILYPFDKYTYTFNQEGEIPFKSSLYENMDPMIIQIEESKQGKQFYNAIGNNLVNFVKEFFGSIFYYITFTLKKILRRIL